MLSSRGIFLTPGWDPSLLWLLHAGRYQGNSLAPLLMGKLLPAVREHWLKRQQTWPLGSHGGQGPCLKAHQTICKSDLVAALSVPCPSLWWFLCSSLASWHFTILQAPGECVCECVCVSVCVCVCVCVCIGWVQRRKSCPPGYFFPKVFV